MQQKKIRVLEAFSGIGTQRMALRNIGVDHEVVAISEIDKFAIKSYEAIHGETNNLGDISQIETADIPDHDLFTYSFPCQDISVVGKGLGLDEGSGTKSGLLWECQKVIDRKRPKYLLLENVKNLVGKKHKPNFDKWLEWLEEQGYTNYWQVLNAKDFGVPQNRERVFVVSILGEHEPYKFPEPIELELRLKDVLEDEVDEKFYLDTEKAKKLIATIASKYEIKEPTPTDGGLKKPKPKEVANTILARYDAGISNQQSTGTMVIEPKAERIDSIFDKDGKAHQAGGGSGNIPKTIEDLRIRKLTPKECWRLMGFSDEDFHKAEEVNSNAQLYKQAGNSIVVNVLEALFTNMLKEED